MNATLLISITSGSYAALGELFSEDCPLWFPVRLPLAGGNVFQSANATISVEGQVPLNERV